MLSSLSRWSFEDSSPTFRTVPRTSVGDADSEELRRSYKLRRSREIAFKPVFVQVLGYLAESGVTPRYSSLRQFLSPLRWDDLPAGVSPRGGGIPEVTFLMPQIAAHLTHYLIK
jgi:hypothetical protein